MLFSSVTFLFCFLPVVTIGYYVLHPILKNLFLLLASLFFYAWGEPVYLTIMIGVIVINYLAGILIDQVPKWKKITIWLAVICNILILGIFKYTDFIIRSLNSVASLNIPLQNIALPIGISFYTFQSLSYVIDLYRGNIKPQYNICKFALYVSLFPQLIAGPIVKYKDVAEQIDRRNENLNDIVEGFRRFIVGLSKKVLIANTMGAVADKIYLCPPSELSSCVAWLGAVAYSLQIFFDFSGYSDMAIGLGRVFGFSFLENFNYPYIASSVTDFWRRWHISLSSWFKEYLYIPLGGNRVSKFRNTLNLITVFFATGLWHGASWNFVVWGLWHGLFLIFEKRFNMQGLKPSYLTTFVKHLYVVLVFVLGWVFFRADNLSMAVDYIMVMLGMKQNAFVGFGLLYYLDRKVIIMLIVAMVCCVPWDFSLFNRIKGFFVVKDIILFCLLIASIASIAASGYNPFIYFRF